MGEAFFMFKKGPSLEIAGIGYPTKQSCNIFVLDASPPYLVLPSKNPIHDTSVLESYPKKTFRSFSDLDFLITH